MRSELVNLNPEEVAKSSKYVMRITGDNNEGKEELDNFILPECRYPVIATTSRLMTTGIDAQTCKLIVIDQNIESLSMFKQIIGRGTRINEDYDKLYFTIMDFRKATELFADKDFDGPPIQIYEPKPDEPVVPPDPPLLDPDDPGQTVVADPFPPDTGGGKRIKYYVSDVPVSVISERVQYYGKDGKLITESLRDYTRKNVKKEFSSLDSFLLRWTTAEKKQAIIDELEEQGILLTALAEEVGKDIDPFDLVCHVAFGRPPLTRRERAEQVRKRNYFAKYADKARVVIDRLLDKYADEGIEHIEDIGILRIKPLNELGTPLEIMKSFGGKEQYLKALHDLEEQLYKVA
jgi:type I restriction enzyme R subunit